MVTWYKTNLFSVLDVPHPNDEKPDGRMCDKCGKRPATERWVGEGGTIGYVHGAYAWWCLRCCLVAQIEYAEGCAVRLPDLRRKLRELDARGD